MSLPFVEAHSIGLPIRVLSLLSTVKIYMPSLAHGARTIRGEPYSVGHCAIDCLEVQSRPIRRSFQVQSDFKNACV